jgi:hypothetical protein
MSRYKSSQYVGVGVGSSSTQAYARLENGDVVVGYDSTAGAKPTRKQSEVRT